MWSVLSDTEGYASWWRARTERIEPRGAARPGQTIYASAERFGRRWPVTTKVLGIDGINRRLELETTLPFGLIVHNRVAVDALDPQSSRLTFG